MLQPTSILLDLTPLGCAPTAKTGLARVAESLATALIERSDLRVSTCAIGSIAASAEYDSQRDCYRHLNPVRFSPSIPEQLALSAAQLCNKGSAFTRAFAHRLSQAANLVRNPVRGIKNNSFDVVHSTYARLPQRARALAPARVMTIHDITALRLPVHMLGAAQRAVTKRIVDSIRPTDWLAFVSDHARDDFLNYKKHPEDRTRTIYNGVNTDIFCRPSDERLINAVLERHGLTNKSYLMTLSSLAPHKNLSVVAQAWPHVLRRIPDAKLLIAGGRSAKTAVVGTTPWPQGSRSVIFTGFIPDSEFAALASNCSAFLFPSLYEGFGLPPLEAMACGAPVIASNRTAVREVLAGAATLIDPEDADAWAIASEAALANPVSRERRCESIKWATGFSWDQAASNYAALYRLALEDTA